MRERRRREWSIPFARSLTKQGARKAPSHPGCVKIGRSWRCASWHRSPSYDLRRTPYDHPDFSSNAFSEDLFSASLRPRFILQAGRAWLRLAAIVSARSFLPERGAVRPEYHDPMFLKPGRRHPSRLAEYFDRLGILHDCLSDDKNTRIRFFRHGVAPIGICWLPYRSEV